MKSADIERIQSKIHIIRRTKVMLDSDLAALYGVEVKRLNEQVKRNRERFPDDFIFELTSEEFDALRSQNATLEKGRHKKYLSYAFTQTGELVRNQMEIL